MKALLLRTLCPPLTFLFLCFFLMGNTFVSTAQQSDNHQPNIVLATGIKGESNNQWDVGYEVPNAAINDVNGKKIELYDLLDKPLVIEIFRVKNAQSKKNKEYLKSFYTKFNINILSITPDDYPNQVRKTAQEMNLMWSQVLDDSKKFAQPSFFLSQGIGEPRFIIVMPDKRVQKVFYKESDIAKVGVALQQHFK